MMNKDMLFHHQQQQQPQQQVVAEENMSNLTSASGDQTTTVSSGNITEASGSMFVIRQQKQCFIPQPQAQSSQPPMKKKRNQPGNPDPEAEVIALSPRTLLTANRFICEICNKGFKRDQNLQLHRRGHNLPWKLKQRSKTEVIRKKVYVCPEPTCVHHEPSRALGDLTGIKKHFCRKHGEKKWKCEKCSKRYAVQSDWKAHSMTCGTKEYRCDCGNLFSRRDSFVTHRAFCDALAEESERAIPTHQPNPTLIQSSNHQTQPNTTSSTSHQLINPHITNLDNYETQPNSNYICNISNNNNNSLREPSIKKEQQSDVNYTVRPQDPHHIIPPWLATLPGPPPYGSTPPPFGFSHQHDLTFSNPNPCGGRGGSAGLFPFGSATVTTASFHHPSPQAPAISATALLQKVAQMGTMNTVPSPANEVNSSHNLATTIASSSASTPGFFSFVGGNANNQSMFQGYNTMCSAVGFEHGEAFEDSFGGFLRTNAATAPEGGEKNGGGGVGEGLTRDFMGLRPLCHSDILSFSDLGDCINDNASERQRQHSH